MLRAIYVIFAVAVLGWYLFSSAFGWELANSGSRSRMGLPFFTGYRGGK